MEPPPRAEPGKSTAAAIWDGAAFGLADAAAEIRTELQKETEERLQEVGAALNERLKDQLAESFENVAAQYPCCESLPLAPLLGAAVSAVASVARGGVDEKLCKQLAVLVDRHGSDSKLLLTQCPSWRRLVAPFALLQQSPAPLSALVMTLCVVVTVWGLPGYTLFQTVDACGEAVGLAMPATAIATWSIRHQIFWVLMLLAAIGVVAAAMFSRDHADIVLCGVLFRRLRRLHHGAHFDMNEAHTVELSGLPQAVVRRVRAGAQSLFSVYVVSTVFACIATVLHYTLNSYASTRNPYYLVHAALLVILVYFALASIFSGMKEKLTQRYHADPASTSGLSVEAYVQRHISTDTRCKMLEQKMLEERQFLIDVRAMIGVYVLPMVNFFYAVTVSIYVVAIFWLYVIFLEARTLASDECGATVSVAAGVAGAVVLSLAAVAQPLFAFASEAHSWQTLVVKPLRSPMRQAASALLSPLHDRNMLFEDHVALQEAMTWTVLGVPMLPSAIAAALSAYLLIVWTTVVWPSISDYVDQLQAKITDV